MKKTIILLFILASSLFAATLLQLSEVNAATSEVRVVSYSYYTASAGVPSMASAQGDLIVVGEVQNVGTQIVNNVTIEGTAFGSSGQVLASSLSEAFVYEMSPGKKAPFYIDFTAQSSTTGDLTWTSQVSNVSVVVTAVTDTPVAPYTGVKIVSNPINSQYDQAGGTYTVSATIENAGNEPVAADWAVVTYYDSSGTVVGVNFTQYLIPFPSPFEPGAYSFFEAVPSDCTAQLASKISSFNVIIDAQAISNTNNQNSPTPTPTSTGGSNLTFPILLVIIIVVLVVVAVAGLLLFRKRQKAHPLPPPPPPA